MNIITLPHQLKTVLCFYGASNAVTCDTVSLKNVQKGWWMIHHDGATDVDLVLTTTQCTDVASATNKATSAVHRIWRDIAPGTTSDTLTELTAAASMTIDPATMNPVLAIIEIDPDIHLDREGGYDCAYLADSGGSAADTVAIYFLALMKNQGKGALTASLITD